MPQPTKGARLGGSAAHQKLMLANLASQLFEHGRITTTEAKARRLRPLAEKLITKAKKGDLHNRRLAAQTIRDKGILHVLFTEIAPRYENRPGGYTRITKLGPRRGDNAPMAVIELVTEQLSGVTTRRTTPAAAAPVEDEVQEAVEETVEAPEDTVEETEAAETETEADEAEAEESK